MINMKLKEIKAEIEGTREKLAIAYSKYDTTIEIGGLVEEEEKSREETNRLEGWLIGLGTAKCIWNRIFIYREGSMVESRVEFEYSLDREITRLGEPKNPFELGEKEALEWCLK